VKYRVITLQTEKSTTFPDKIAGNVEQMHIYYSKFSVEHHV